MFQDMFNQYLGGQAQPTQGQMPWAQAPFANPWDQGGLFGQMPGQQPQQPYDLSQLYGQDPMAMFGNQMNDFSQQYAAPIPQPALQAPQGPSPASQSIATAAQQQALADWQAAKGWFIKRTSGDSPETNEMMLRNWLRENPTPG